MGRAHVQGSSFEIICEYVIPVHVSKSNMRTRIKELETRLKHSEHIFRSLTTETHAAAVLKQLKEGDSTEKIYQYLASRQSPDSEHIPREQEDWEISSQLSRAACRSAEAH
jgi:aminopeptidase C